MKNTTKILALVLVLMMSFAVLSAFSFTASAANIPGGTKLYLVPSSNWNESNARFAAYFFGNGESWVSMTKVAGESNLYEVTVPAGSWTNVIFCRMNPGATANNWNNKWNQTSDLTYNGTSNCYTVKEGTWDKGGGTWSTYGSDCTHANVGPEATCTTSQDCLDCGDPVVSALGHTYNSAHLCTRCNVQATFTVAGSGAHLGTEWDTGNTANDMTYADGVYTKVYENVAAGSYLFKVVRDHDWGTAYPDADKAYTVATAGSTVTITLKGTAVTVDVVAPHTHSFVEGKCECGEVDPDYVAPHVNALVVGDTNKIVVSGEYVNQFDLPVEWVPFTAEENANYSFVGDNGALAYIFNADGTALVGVGTANLEAGTYLVCLGNGVVGEFNVAVTKSAWVNALVEGANKLLITDALDNGYGFYIVWVSFEVTEKANYTFTGEGLAILVYDAEGKNVGTELEVGTYNVCVAFSTPKTTGVATVNVTKTAIGGGEEPVDPPVDVPTHDGEQEFFVGENTVIIDGCTLNLTNNAVEMVKFVVTEKARYTFTGADYLNTYIATTTDPKDYPNGYLGGVLTNEGILEPGTYYICCGRSGDKGTFTVTVTVEAIEENCEHDWAPAHCAAPSTCKKCGETEGEPNPEVHVTFFDTCTTCGKDVPSIKLGNNHISYVKGVMLMDHYFKVYIPEGGTYEISGGAPVVVYMWSVPTHLLEGGALTMDTPYGFNIDAMTESGFADSFTITVPEAGIYWFAFDFEHVTEDTLEFDVEITFKEPLPEEKPEDKPEDKPAEQPAPEMNWFEKLIAMIIEFFKKLFGLA